MQSCTLASRYNGFGLRFNVRSVSTSPVDGLYNCFDTRLTAWQDLGVCPADITWK